MEELLEVLQVIDDGTFYHHVNDEKNDFSNWILGEVKDKVLARQVSKTKDKEKIILLLDKRVNNDAKRKQFVIAQIKEAIENE